VENLLKHLDQARHELAELERLLGDPSAHGRQDFADLSRRYARLRELVQRGEELRALLEEIKEEEELLAAEEDEALREELRRAIEQDQKRAKALAQEIKRLLVPERPEDRRNAIVEIRAGAGGEESALFAADLFRMYSRYAERKGWKVKVMDSHPTPLGGFKQIVFAVEGRDAYGRLRYESGVHRVQRVPVTESSGRIHTSTATVAVLPEAEDVEVEINPDDLKIETYCASGPGGQHMQKNETAVRITHIPTGLAKLRDLEEKRREAELRETRRRQIGTGDRSEKIRTYNFPQSRVTDHRIGLTIYRLEEVLDGDLDLVIDPLLKEELTRALEA